MEFNLRKLKSTDIFLITSILKKIGVDEIKAIMNQPYIQNMVSGGEKTNATSLGMNVVLDVVGLVCSNLPKAEKEIYNFCASVSGMPIEEVKDLEMMDFIDLIMAIVKKEEFKDFFMRISKSFQA